MAEMTVAATLENLEAVTRFVRGRLARAGCPERLIGQVELAVEEIYVNIARYAYHPEAGEATIRCEAGGDPPRVTIGFADAGRPFNPLDCRPPDLAAGVPEREPGGLGVYLVRRLMDEITYEFRDGKNILTIRKKVGAAPAGDR